MSSYWPDRTDQMKKIKKAVAINPEISINTYKIDILFYLNPLRVASQFTATVVNNTTDMLDMGIRIAANTGVRFPETAKLNPTTLYKNEIIKLEIIT